MDGVKHGPLGIGKVLSRRMHSGWCDALLEFPASAFTSDTAIILVSREGPEVSVDFDLTRNADCYPYDRHRSVTGPLIGWAIVVPVRLASSKLAFSPKYHLAGRSASSISMRRGSCLRPSACRIIVSWS